MSMTPEEVLNKAIDIIERDGWHQGSSFKCLDEGSYFEMAKTAPVCALGALARAMTGSASTIASNDEEQVLYFQAEELLAAQMPSLEHWNGIRVSIPSWNDAPERTKEDVILAMKKAAHHDS